MLQARTEQPGDAPSPEAGATLQQPQSNLQPTGTTGANSTSTPQTTPAVTQQQLQSPNLRVGDTQTLIANSTVAQPVTTQTSASFTWLWVAIIVLAAVAIAWRMRAMSVGVRAVQVTDAADVPPPIAARAVRAEAAAPTAKPENSNPASKKPKKAAKASRRHRKQKRS